MEKFAPFENKTETKTELLTHEEFSALQEKMSGWLHPEDAAPEEVGSRKFFIDEKIDHLRKTYPEAKKVQAFYLFTGGSPDAATIRDFPERDSVCRYIQEEI